MRGTKEAICSPPSKGLVEGRDQGQRDLLRKAHIHLIPMLANTASRAGGDKVLLRVSTKHQPTGHAPRTVSVRYSNYS